MNKKNKSFRALFVTQFLGALNDNFFKNSLVLLITFGIIRHETLKNETLLPLIGGLFILPFLLFSSLSGQVSDFYSKIKTAKWIKGAEIVIMLLAGFGFYQKSLPLLFFTLFLMGMHSTFFGPLKYSLLPEILPSNQLLKGNAFIEAGTFLAILVGTVGSGVLISLKINEPYPQLISSISLYGLTIALFGWISSLFLKESSLSFPSSSESVFKKISFHPWKDLKTTYDEQKNDPILFSCLLGISQFWFLGAAILTLLPMITLHPLHGDPSVLTLFLALFTIGIGLGSVLCEKCSKRNFIERAYIPIGSFFIFIFLICITLSLSLFPPIDGALLNVKSFLFNSALLPYSLPICISFFGLSIASGFYTVPLYTLLQTQSRPSHRSRVIALNNFINALFMILSSLFLMLLLKYDCSPIECFFTLSILQFITTFLFYKLAPDHFYRYVCQWITSLLFKVTVKGNQYIPETGPVILLSNHISFIDWLILQSSVLHPIRFVMYFTFFKIPIFRTVCKHSHIIPIAENREDFKIIINSFKIISNELKDNQMVCLFPEGGISYDGKVGTFKRGIEIIIEKDPVPLIPVYLEGMYGGIFSRAPGTFFEKLKKTFGTPLTVTFGEAIFPPKDNLRGYREECRKLYFKNLNLEDKIV